MTSLHLLLTDKPAIAPPVFVFQKDKAQKVSGFFSFSFDAILNTFVDLILYGHSVDSNLETLKAGELLSSNLLLQRSAEGSSAEDGEGKATLLMSLLLYLIFNHTAIIFIFCWCF